MFCCEPTPTPPGPPSRFSTYGASQAATGRSGGFRSDGFVCRSQAELIVRQPLAKPATSPGLLLSGWGRAEAEAQLTHRARTGGVVMMRTGAHSQGHHSPAVVGSSVCGVPAEACLAGREITVWVFPQDGDVKGGVARTPQARSRR